MGQPASIDVYIEYDGDPEVVKKLENFIELANAGKLGGDFNIHLVNDGDYISIEISSGRVQNAEWQAEMLLEECKKIDSISQFSSTITIPTEGLYWNREDDQI